MIVVRVIFFIITVFTPSFSVAESNNFARTSEEMISILSYSQPRARGISLSKSMTGRGIIVVSNQDGKIIKETMMVGGSHDNNKINLKIEFDYNSSTIKPCSRMLLSELAKALNHSHFSGKKFIVSGHTDSDGSDGYNYHLSLRRALAVRDYLVSRHGINVNCLGTYGCGEVLPIFPNDTPEHRQINRRVEIKLAK